MNRSFVQRFKEEYYQKLITPSGNNPVRNRADSLLLVFQLLEKLKPQGGYTIIETGTMRADHGELNYGGDGCSTKIFDEAVNYCGGVLLSIDINPQNCAYANRVVSSRTKIIHSDSVLELHSISSTSAYSMAAQLLYLDSYDVERDNPHPSALHHLMELTAAIPLLRPKSIIVIDDADAFFDGGATGKATYIRQYFDKLGKKPIYDGYQLIYQLD